MSTLALYRQQAVGRLADRSRQWAKRRQGIDPRHLELQRRRIYILPTRTGFIYALTVFVLLLGSMNYNNNMGFALCFLLAGIGLVAMHHCHRNLVGLQLDFQRVEPVFAGQDAHFRFRLGNSRSTGRWQIGLAWDRGDTRYIDVDAGAGAQTMLPLPAALRGWLAAPRLALSTAYPLGLFRAWAWVNMDIAVLVYPQPVDASTVPDRMPDPRNTGGQQQIGEEDFSGLREFRPGDSPRRVAWKSFARLGTLLVKEYREGGQTPLWIDWDAIAAPDIETRLSILTRLVLDANRERVTFGLRLPGSSFGPQADHAHLHRCLRQLATFGLSGNRTAEPPPRRGRS